MEWFDREAYQDLLSNLLLNIIMSRNSTRRSTGSVAIAKKSAEPVPAPAAPGVAALSAPQRLKHSVQRKFGSISTGTAELLSSWTGGRIMKKGRSQDPTLSQEFGSTVDGRPSAKNSTHVNIGPNEADGSMEDMVDGDLQSEDGEMDVDMNDENFQAFKLPKSEEHLLIKVKKEIEENATWARFDGFFGIFLVLNSVFMGLQLQFEDGRLFIANVVIESAFLVIFIIEFLLRFGLLKDPKRIFSDRWSQFDFVIIVASAFDLWGQADILPFPISVLRLLRLMRLAKLMRVVQKFRALGQLADALFDAAKTMFWMIVLQVFVFYVFGILMVLLARWVVETERSGGNDFEWANEVESDWPDIPTAMLKLQQIATFDDWAGKVRRVAFEGDHPILGGVLAFYQLINVTFSGMGLMSLFVGAFCHQAFLVDRHNKRLQGAETLLKQRAALATYRDILKNYGERPLFKDCRFISTAEVMTCFQDTPVAAECLQILELNPSEVFQLAWALESNNEILTDGLIEAISITLLQRHMDVVGTDFFGKHNDEIIKPDNMIFLEAGFYETLDVVESAENSFAAVSTMACIETLKGRDSECFMHDQDNLALKNIKTLKVHLEMLEIMILQAKVALPMDVTFGFFIVLNGIFSGILADADDPQQLHFFVIDVFFCVVFISEIFLRAILFANLEETSAPKPPSLMKHRTKGCLYLMKKLAAKLRRKKKKAQKTESSTSESRMSLNQTMTILGLHQSCDALKETHANLILGVFPPMPKGGLAEVIKDFPSMLRNPWTCADIIIVLLTAVDTCVLGTMYQIDGSDRSGSVIQTLGVLRILRLFRLVRLFRVFKLFPGLNRILLAFGILARALSCFLALLCLIVFIFSVLARTQFAPQSYEAEWNGSQKSRSWIYWSSLSRCFLSWLQVLTLDDWQEIASSAADQAPAASFIAFAVFLFSMSFGFMNMIVGVVCDIAIGVRAVEDEDQEKQDKAAFFDTLHSIREVFENEGKDTLTVEDLREIFGRKSSYQKITRLASEQQLFRQTSKDFKSDFKKSRSASSIVDKANEENHISTPRQQKLQELFLLLNLSLPMLCRIFRTLDFDNNRVIDIDVFITGCIAVAEDMGKIDILAVGSLLKATLADMRKCIQKSKLLRMICLNYPDELHFAYRKLQKKTGRTSGIRKNPEVAGDRPEVTESQMANFLSEHENRSFIATSSCTSGLDRYSLTGHSADLVDFAAESFELESAESKEAASLEVIRELQVENNNLLRMLAKAQETESELTLKERSLIRKGLLSEEDLLPHQQDLATGDTRQIPSSGRKTIRIELVQPSRHRFDSSPPDTARSRSGDIVSDSGGVEFDKTQVPPNGMMASNGAGKPQDSAWADTVPDGKQTDFGEGELSQGTTLMNESDSVEAKRQRGPELLLETQESKIELKRIAEAQLSTILPPDSPRRDLPPPSSAAHVAQPSQASSDVQESGNVVQLPTWMWELSSSTAGNAQINGAHQPSAKESKVSI